MSSIESSVRSSNISAGNNINDKKRSRSKGDESSIGHHDKKPKIDQSIDHSDKPSTLLSTDILLSALEFLEKDDGSRCKCVCKDWNNSIAECSSNINFWLKLFKMTVDLQVKEEEIKDLSTDELKDFKKDWWTGLVEAWEEFIDGDSSSLAAVTEKEKSELLSISAILGKNVHGTYEVLKNTSKYFTISSSQKQVGLLHYLTHRSTFIKNKTPSDGKFYKVNAFGELRLNGAYAAETPLLEILKNEVTLHAATLDDTDFNENEYTEKLGGYVKYHCRQYNGETGSDDGNGDGNGNGWYRMQRTVARLEHSVSLLMDRRTFHSFQQRSSEFKLKCKVMRAEKKAKELECAKLDPNDPDYLVKLIDRFSNHRATQEQIDRLQQKYPGIEQDMKNLFPNLPPEDDSTTTG